MFDAAAGTTTAVTTNLAYLLQVAGGSSDSSLVANLFYMSSVALLALAAWAPMASDPPERLDGWSVVLVPAAFVSAALGLLIYDHFDSIGSLALFLATATIFAAVARAGLAFRDLRELADTRQMALTDDLTSLPNRRLFSLRLDEAIEAVAETGSPFAVMIVDLDHFKELNDTLGHQTGDLLLRDVGLRLTAILRPGDTGARLGGDEFGIVLAAPAGDEAARAAAARLREALRSA